MVSVIESAVIDAPVEDVWRILRDFNSHVHWHPAIAASEIEDGVPPDAVGAVRRFTLADGSLLREQLLSSDHAAHELSYCLIEGPLPLFNYVATIRLKAVTDGGGTFWQWRSTFEPPAAQREAMVALVRDGIYRAGFRALAGHLRGLQQRPAIPAQAERTPSPAGRTPTVDERSVPAASRDPVDVARTQRSEAIVVERHGGPEVLQLRQVDVPPPGPGKVRVRHSFIGVNFIDVYCRTGYFDLLALPGTPGMEASGRIEAVGTAVHGLSVGDRIAYACPPVGAYTGLRVMDPELIVKLPPDIDEEVAAAALLKGVAASFLLHDVHAVKPGEIVLVHAAAGGIGSILTQWAAHLGARVVATVSTEDKASIPLSNGAAQVIVRRREDFADAVMEMTDGHGADIIYDAIGADSFERSLAALAVRGHLVSYGQASGPVGSWDIGRFASKSIMVSRPNYGHFTDTPEKIGLQASRFFEAVRRGIVHVRPPARYPLSDAARAHADLESGRTTGSMVLVP